jgi:hypothetical protein
MNIDIPNSTITRRGSGHTRTGRVHVVAETGSDGLIFLFINSPAGVDHFSEFDMFFTVDADPYTDLPVRTRRYYEELDNGYDDDGWRFEEMHANVAEYLAAELRWKGVLPTVVANPDIYFRRLKTA